MPAFADVYSAKMRAALFMAAIDCKRGVKGALADAAAGEMPALAADEQRILAGMSYGYAAELVREERERRTVVRQVADDVSAVAHDVARELAQLARLETRRLTQERVRKPKDPVDTDAGVKVARMAAAALQLARDAAAPAKSTGKAPAADAPRAPAAPRSVAALIANSDDTAAGDNKATADASERSAARINTTEDTPNHTSAGAVRLNARAAAVRGGSGAVV